MTVGSVTKYSSSSRTPRQQLLLAHTNGRSKLDAMRVITNPTPHGVKTFQHQHDEKQSTVVVTKRTGTKKVDTTNNHAARIAQGSGGIEVPKTYRHIQRRHFDASAAAIKLRDMPETPSPKRGKFHRPTFKPQEKGLTNMALVDGEEKRYQRKDHDEEIKKDFVEMTSPKRHHFTFSPVKKVDNRGEESRLMADGGRRKERARDRSRVLTAAQATRPPWATE